MSALQTEPLNVDREFNWVFLVEVLIVTILAPFFLFYFNRLFATIVCLAIRAYTWNQFKAYIDIEALQISVLGGRIFFKSIRYHAHNVTLYVYEGHVTWRYWLRLVKDAELFQEEAVSQHGKMRASSTSASEKDSKAASSDRARDRSPAREEQAGGKPKKELPCRISVKVSGVEAFIYNRSPVYDAVVEATLGKANKASEGMCSNGGSEQSSPPSSRDNEKTQFGAKADRTTTHETAASTAPKDASQIPAFLRIFPIKIECKRAAAALGNESTKNIVTAKAEHSVGTVDAGHSGPLDLWKLLFNFDIQQVVVAMKPNRDFKELQLDAAQRALRERELEEPQTSQPLRETAQKAQCSWNKFFRFLLRSKNYAGSLRNASVDEKISHRGRTGKTPIDQLPGQGQWHGLMRYLDENEVNEHDEWQQIEYAKASELVNVPKVTMKFYWDIPGPVVEGNSDQAALLGSLYQDDINGALPPDYGMDLGVHGGVVVYGPWADRQRLNLQPIFVPATYVDATPAKPLKPGELRLPTIFKIKVIVEDDVVMRIPTREESKDPRWKGRAGKSRPDENQGNNTNETQSKHWRKHRHGLRRKKKRTSPADVRPYGWIDATVKKDSVVNFNMDMYARATGYRNTLDLDVKGIEMSSSVNHDLLWRSGPLTLDADISQPTSWNSLRKWPFNIVVHDMELFILRDHLFLIIDLVNDWASGAPSDFYTFVPYKYQLDLTLKNFTMYLNVNDANIINDPSNFERNDFLTIEGQLHAILGIPMEHHRPKRNQISFDVLAQDLQMRMISSAKNTLHAFVEDKTMAKLPKLTLNGSYNANQELRVGNVDVLRMDIVGTGLNLKAFGFFVRQLVNIKENYFGDYLHFKTLEEFQGASDNLDEANAKTASFPKPIAINELDVILCIVAEEATVMFPTNLYSCKDFIRVDLPRADLDLRIVSYYLDMGLQLSPVSLSTGTRPDTVNDDLPTETTSSTQLYVRHVSLNGHRSFGLPPNEEAYVSQWDIDIGKVTGELSSEFVRDLALVGQTFVFSIADAENALPVTSPAVVLDASFVQVRTDIVRLWMRIGRDALLLETAPITVETSDWAKELFSQRVTVIVPLVTVACVDGISASRHRIRGKQKKLVKTYAFLQTGVSLDVVGRKAQFEQETKRQQSHFRLHDQRTARFPFLIRPEIDAPVSPEDDIPFEPAAMIYPYPPQPLVRRDQVDHWDPSKARRSFTSSKRLLSKSSSSSLSASLRSAQSVLPTTKRPGLHPRNSQNTETNVSPSFHSFAGSNRSSTPDSELGPQEGQRPHVAERADSCLPTSTMAFSSSYLEPYFPLELVEPDERMVPPFPSRPRLDESTSDQSSIAAAIGDPDINPDAEHMTVMLKITPGLRAFVDPHVAITASKLVQKVLPKRPEEVMDALQMNVMGIIQAQNAILSKHSKVLEIQASLPAAHMRVVILDQATDEVVDQVDVEVDALETLVRTRSEPAPTDVNQILALHTSLGGLRLSLGQLRNAAATGPAVCLDVDDVLVWLALTKGNAFHVSFRDTALVVDGLQAKYLTHLALRLVPLVNDLKSKFEEIKMDNARRLLLLTYALTEHGETLGDPPFMARMLYILRAYPSHFRNSDSWRIVSRFRHILYNLPHEAMVELAVNCNAANMQCPEDAPKRGLESWTQRHWDVPQLNQTTAFKVLFKPVEPDKAEPSDAKSTTVTFKSESFRIAIQTGESRSEIVLEETSLGVEDTPPTKPEGLMLVDENKRAITNLQVHTSNVAVSLNWSLFQIVEDVLALKSEINEIKLSLPQESSRTPRQTLEDGLARHDFHLVVSTDTGSIVLESINLRHLSRADSLRVSVVGTTQASEHLGHCVNAMLNTDTAITELHGPSSRIWQTLLTSPSIYVDHVQPIASVNEPPTVTLAIAYDDFEIMLTEQVPEILHVIDSVILDEVAKVQRLIEEAQSAESTPPQSAVAERTFSGQSSGGSAPVKFNVAVLAGKIHFEVALLSTLSYQLEGKAASVRIAPSLSQEKMFSIDFDVGRHNHAFVNSSGNERHTQGLLEVPPINGHVGLELGKDETSISVSTTIEKVEVDAGAIQGVLAVVNRSEVQDVISAIKSGLEDINTHVVEVFPKDERPSPPQPVPTAHKPQIVFDTRLALLGIRVSASTPQVFGPATTEVEFGIGPLHATASNKTTPGEVIPEVRAQIQDIGASLSIRDRGTLRPCGNATLSMNLDFSKLFDHGGVGTRELKVRSNGMEVNAYPETAATIVDVINHLQDRIKHLDLSKEVEYLRRLRDKRKGNMIPRIKQKKDWTADEELPFSPEDLLAIKTTIELTDIQACWLVSDAFAAKPGSHVDDVVFSIQSVELTTRGGHEARLNIQDVQLQLAKKKHNRQYNALNSALLPYVGFSVGYWSHANKRNLAFKATGKPLELRLESRFVLPVTALQHSIELAMEKFKQGTATWQNTPTITGAPRSTAKAFDTKSLASVLVEADFAGAKVFMQGSGTRNKSLATMAATSQQQPGAQHGRYGQFATDRTTMQTTLTAPGIAFKLEYNSNDHRQPTINAELMIDASSNMLLPNVVPLIMEVSNSVKELVHEPRRDSAPAKPAVHEITKPAQKFFEDQSIVTTSPAKIFGKTKVDLGFRIAKQEFGLSCQPIARVDAKASLEDFYLTMNTIDSDEHGHFFAISAMMTKLTAQVKHMYSREPTFSYDMDSIVLSAMNNKHLNGSPGVSAILNLNPTRITINGKQFQDLLIFREIWLPPEIRNAAAASQASTDGAPASRPDEYLMQKYQTVAAAAAFPWNATVHITKLAVDVDLGQSIGKSSFTIGNLWASQQKSSNWEQDLCIGMDEMGIDSTGRMSGFVQLEKLAVRTSIKWPQNSAEAAAAKTPLIQASIGFQKLLAKAAFDYQPFAFADVEAFDFLMYNVRESSGSSDRLVAVLDCGKAFIFCTSTSPAQAVGLYQAFDRLIQEKQTAYVQSLKDIEKHLRRESTVVPTRFGPDVTNSPITPREAKKTHISLHTDVVVTIGAICFGVYPSTFFDSQMLKLEAHDIQARFAVGLEGGKIVSGLGMTLGQLQVALSSVRRVTAVPKALEVTVAEVTSSALNAKGGTIVRVPKVVASMQTWQAPESKFVDYVFKSLLDGKIDVGWNLSRINFIKGMWTSHSRALASRLGKALPESAVKITAGPSEDTKESDSKNDSQVEQQQRQQQEKITAEINLPQSRYEYNALEPPIIETPQLRDMGEATPPLEWIGLNRDRLPNVTHQIVIVSLLEVCKEVQDAYEKILGSS